MKRTIVLLVALTSCATVPGGGAPAPEGVHLEVIGRVVRACASSRPQPNEMVTVRAAGELDTLDTTRTDASGAFSFRVIAPGRRPALLIEAAGKKALARYAFGEGGTLVAEVRLPCEG